MSSKSFATLAAVIFSLAAAAQLWRAYSAIAVSIGGNEIPVMVSWIVGSVLAVLALLGFTSRA
ncbi:MAG: hypothetical protein U1E87_08405 [Alphaproteobacteria bacterium]